MSQPVVPTVTLARGVSTPRIGLGTWPMTGKEGTAVVATAIALGYRLIDTAYAYGNEESVGRGLRASGIPREEVFVTSKLNGQWHGYDAAQVAFEASAKRLGVDYLDLYLIHWPMPTQNRYVEAWRGFAKLLEDGRVRAIGVSNFKPAHIDRLLTETGVLPDVNQIELNPTVTREATCAYLASRGIAAQSWSPIGRGGELLAAPIIAEIAQRHQKTPAQVVLRWHVELGLIPLPRSVNTQRLAQNLDIFNFALTAGEIAGISALDRGEQAAVDSDVIGH
jgi:2,5-diketo-D-gluconate reductase A